MFKRGMRALAPLAAMALVAGCAGGGELEAEKDKIDQLMEEEAAVDEETMCDLTLDDEANNDGLMMDMITEQLDEDVSDEAIDEWVSEKCGDVEAAKSPSPDPTVTETATTEPPATSTVTPTPEDSSGTAEDAEWDILFDAFYKMTNAEQDALCEYWQTDAQGAVDQFTADESMPVSESVFREWATFTCG